ASFLSDYPEWRLAGGVGAAGWRLSGSAQARGADLECGNREPRRRYHDEGVREHGAVLALRAVRLGGNVPIGIVERQEIRLGGLVERVDQELRGKEQQEHRGHAEEEGEVDAVPIARPRPGKQRREAEPGESPPNEERSLRLPEERGGDE